MWITAAAAEILEKSKEVNGYLEPREIQLIIRKHYLTRHNLHYGESSLTVVEALIHLGVEKEELSDSLKRCQEENTRLVTENRELKKPKEDSLNLLINKVPLTRSPEGKLFVSLSDLRNIYESLLKMMDSAEKEGGSK